PSRAAMPSPEEIQYLEDLQHWLKEETGYQAIQGTKPQTLAYGLTDSPIGLAAWIVEKFRTWSDCGGDVERRFSKDDLLTNITIYWVAQTAASAARLYWERERAFGGPAVFPKVSVPTGCALFPKEIMRPPRTWAERSYNVTR